VLILIKQPPAVRRRLWPMGWMHYLPSLWMFYSPTTIRVLIALALALAFLPVAVFRRI
jgi:hypothetical protein